VDGEVVVFSLEWGEGAVVSGFALLAADWVSPST
jgi:hypothetical protein